MLSKSRQSQKFTPHKYVILYVICEDWLLY